MTSYVEGSPSASSHTPAEWQALRDELAAASDAHLAELVGRYAWNVIWPTLDPAARAARIAALPGAEKRHLLLLLFTRMLEKHTSVAANWDSLETPEPCNEQINH